MKKLMLMSLLAAAVGAPLAGQADADRINLWPIVGYEDGALDVIWPLGHFKNANDWRFFPIIRDDNLFSVFPEFWFWDDAFAILPFYVKYDFHRGTLFPVLWWDCAKNDTCHSIFPLYYYHGQSKDMTFWAGCGLIGYDENSYDGRTNHWFLPLYAKAEQDFYSIPYSRRSEGEAYTDIFLCGLAGRGVDAQRQTDSHWCFPLYYRGRNEFASLPIYLDWNAGGDLDSWLSPLLLSCGKMDDNTWREWYLFGFAGRSANAETGFRESWCAPLYYANSQGTLVTPLVGGRKDTSWLLPLYYTDREKFVSLPYAHYRDDAEKSDTYFILPLLSGVTKYDDGRRNLSALILYGHGSDAQGKTCYDYLFPFYHYDNDTGDFASLLYGRRREGSHTNTWWATPLVGTRSGSRTGVWLFPFFSREKDASFDRNLARLDAPTIPEDITFTSKIRCWTNSNNKLVRAWTNTVPSVRVESRIRGSVFLVSDFDHFIHANLVGPKEDRYRLEENSKRGNRLMFNRETSRAAIYDINTRRKIGERRKSETTVLGGLFHDERKTGTETNTSRAHTRILWKLWDREERNGDVTVDAFPGFTYDSKANGYTKTSFFWRFFRYEKDPTTGTKVDFLFIPVYR